MTEVPSHIREYVESLFSECNLVEKVLREIEELPRRLAGDLGWSSCEWGKTLFSLDNKVIKEWALDYIYELSIAKAKESDKDICEYIRKMVENDTIYRRVKGVYKEYIKPC